MPYIDHYEEVNTKRRTAITRKKNIYRAVAVVATQTIGHGEELYTDYLLDQRLDPNNIEYSPDWLLEPPEASPYLQKKEFVANVPWLIRVMHGHQIAQLGRKAEVWQMKTQRELPESVEKRKSGRIAEKLEKQRQLSE